jgi:hypothetical protein
MPTNTNPDPNPISVSLPWGQDLIVTPDGSIEFCTGDQKIQQRIIRRYYTCPAEKLEGEPPIVGDYLMDQTYGLGASRLIGQPISPKLAAKLTQKINAAVLVDESVDTTQPPDITLYATPGSNTVWAKVLVYLLNNTTIELTFPANGTPS